MSFSLSAGRCFYLESSSTFSSVTYSGKWVELGMLLFNSNEVFQNFPILFTCVCLSHIFNTHTLTDTHTYTSQIYTADEIQKKEKVINGSSAKLLSDPEPLKKSLEYFGPDDSKVFYRY